MLFSSRQSVRELSQRVIKTIDFYLILLFNIDVFKSPPGATETNCLYILLLVHHNFRPSDRKRIKSMEKMKMETLIEFVRLLAGLSTEKMTIMLAFGALGVAALAVNSARKNGDR